nr:MAG TPA: hypothetical protein [Caudoviricetes sp.]
MTKKFLLLCSSAHLQVFQAYLMMFCTLSHFPILLLFHVQPLIFLPILPVSYLFLFLFLLLCTSSVLSFRVLFIEHVLYIAHRSICCQRIYV